MFIHQRSIFLKETDATGVIYFTSLFQYSLEAFEMLLREKGIALPQVLAKGYLMPIVHAEADFKTPLKVGDTISIGLSLAHIGNRSFSIDSEVKTLPDQREAGSVKIVHSFMKKEEKSASEIPDEIRDLLNKIIL